MNYIVSLTYMDDKVLNVALPEDEVPKFLEKLQKSEPYWAPNETNAFWTSNAQVRYVNIAKAAEPAPEPTKVTPIDEAKEEITTDEIKE